MPVSLIEAQASGIKCIASDTMPKQVKLMDNIELLPLNNMDDWVDTIMKNQGYIRQKKDDDIRKSGYDMSATAKWIQEYYLNLIANS